MYFLNGFAYVG